MSISLNAIFRFDINNFKWLWVYFIVSFSRRINLCDATQNTEKHHLYSLLSGSYLMDKYQTYSANFLAKSAYSRKNSLQVFLRKYANIALPLKMDWQKPCGFSQPLSSPFGIMKIHGFQNILFGNVIY